MAYYKYSDVLTHDSGDAFDKVHSPAAATPFTGIYRCTQCRHEIGSTKGHPLPAQNHAQHPPGRPIQWRLIVAAHPVV